MQKLVTLFGGSFNPPHQGHFEMAGYIHRTLKSDEIWMVFSENPLKDMSVYPALEHRMNMARILAPYFDPAIILSDIEDRIAQKIGRHDTYFVLAELQRIYPDTKFIWAMGADTFSNLHLWKERADIMDEYILAVIDRPGYTEKALNSPAAKEFAAAAFDYAGHPNLREVKSGWCFIDGPKIDISSTAIMEKIRKGDCDFPPPFSHVAEYIYANGLYGTKMNKGGYVSCKSVPTTTP